MKQLLTINSIDRDSGTSTSFHVPVKSPVPYVQRVKLKEVLVPNTVYRIRAGVNDQVAWHHSTDFAITVPPGCYTTTTLLSTIQAAMLLADANSYAWSYSADTLRVTVTGSAAFSLLWSTAHSMWRELGWNNSNTGSATSQTAPNVFSLYEPLILLIQVREIGQAGCTTAGIHYTFRLTFKSNSGEVIDWAEAQFYEQEVSVPGVNIGELNVSLTYLDGSLVDLGAAEWHLDLELEC